jgi:serine/threonine protein kinase
MQDKAHAQAFSERARETFGPGERIGHFEILAFIGSGGMGEVYKARDTRLGRTVALKRSREQFTSRFEREARAIAALNHPNICQLYDIGPDYLVMELVEGTSPKGPMPLDDALAIARQIANALDAAHKSGIVHRDLKPGNIKVTPDRVVKVLDFGLAKVNSPAAPENDTEQSPTVPMSATQPGFIVGTAAYMAPEQARGKAVDKRADIWAFGVLLYELLTGEQLFQGEDTTEILASIVKGTPDLRRAPAEAHRLLASCLEKNVDKRLRDIGDAWHLLDAAPAPRVERGSQRMMWVSIAAVAIAILGLAAWVRNRPRAVAIPELAFSITLPHDAHLFPPAGQMSAPQISPDGSAILLTAEEGLFVRRLNSHDAKFVLGSKSAANMAFWSPDSASVAFPTGAGWVKVRLPDGAPESITNLSSPTRGGTWHKDGKILIAVALANSPGGLVVVPAAGGEPRPVSGLPPGLTMYPEFLPGSDDFFFLNVNDTRNDTRAGEPEEYIATLHGETAVQPVPVLKNATVAHYTPAGGGLLLFVRNDNLYAQKFNREQRRVEGEARLVASGVSSYPGEGVKTADFSVAVNGTIAWRAGTAGFSQITKFDRHGNVIGTAGPPEFFRDISLSPDGLHLLASSTQNASIVEVGKSGALALPPAIGWRFWSSSAAGGRLVGITSGAIWELPGDGSGGPVVAGRFATLNKRMTVLGDISPDGTKALFNVGELADAPRPAIIAIPLGTTAAPAPVALFESREPVFGAHFSPDGRWIAYIVGRKPSPLFVQAYPGPGGRREIAPDAQFPVWRGDGKEILYLAPEGLMSITVENRGGELSFGDPHRLFAGLRRAPGVYLISTPLAVSRDGSQIFWLKGPDQPDSNLVNVRTGWVK